MDFEGLEVRIRNSYRYITKRKAPDLEDDCVQECLLAFWRKGRGQTVDQAVIDFLRKESGRKGSPGYDARLALSSAGEIPARLSTSMKDPSIDPREGLSGRLSHIAGLYSEGFTFKEIAESLDVSESRVSQIFKDYAEKMQILLLLPKEVRLWTVTHAF